MREDFKNEIMRCAEISGKVDSIRILYQCGYPLTVEKILEILGIRKTEEMSKWEICDD